MNQILLVPAPDKISWVRRKTYLSAFLSFDERLLLTSEQFDSEIRKMTTNITKTRPRCKSASFTIDIFILIAIRYPVTNNLHCCTIQF